MNKYFYVVFVQDDWYRTRIFDTKVKSVKYAKTIKEYNPEIRKVDKFTNDFMVISL